MAFAIRAATEADAPVLLDLIRSLAAYERLADRVVADEAALRATLFGPRPYAEAVLGIADGLAVGYALFFHSYSSFLARPGLVLEDLFVRPEARGRGYGTALLSHVARVAVDRGCGRLEWSVLDWNEPAIRLYRHLGAQPLSDWTIYRIDGRALAALAARAR
ncbi:MAG: GNAT family N-acetyltransferase [Deltaproteobacteria bacterium]|nr:MAG: GNAT family N-acetyltransferase [Deltaproteobacteria bacterium]